MLDLFEKVEIKKTDRLSGEDLEHIKGLQERFDNDKQIFKELENHITYKFSETETSPFFSFDNLRKELKERLKNSTKDFICKTYSHFRYKYNVKLSDNLLDMEKFTRNNWTKFIDYMNSLDYDVILDDINSQLGTLDFINKGKQEFLDKAKNDIGYKMSHKNNKVSYSGLVRQDEWDKNEISYSYIGNLNLMFKSINLFENDNYSLSTWADNFSTLCRSNRGEIEVFSTHTNIPYAEIEHIKIFKNGKVELKFEDYETAKKYYDMFFKESRY